jgi:uncharacterized membrane protein YkvI
VRYTRYGGPGLVIQAVLVGGGFLTGRELVALRRLTTAAFAACISTVILAAIGIGA